MTLSKTWTTNEVLTAADLNGAFTSIGWGYIAKTASASTASITGAVTDVMTVTFTAVANRRYKISFYVVGLIITSGANVIAYITDNTPTVLQTSNQGTLATGAYYTGLCFVEVNPTAGSKTYRGRISTTGGGVTLQGSGTTIHYLLVEDIGPNP